MFKTLVSEKILRHKYLRNKGNLTREFDTGEIVVLRKQVKSRRKEEIPPKLVFKTKLIYRVLETATPI